MTALKGAGLESEFLIPLFFFFFLLLFLFLVLLLSVSVRGRTSGAQCTKHWHVANSSEAAQAK